MANEDTHNEHFEKLCAGYVLHALDREERDKFEQMLADANDSQRQLYQEFLAVSNQLAFAAEKHTPSETVKEGLMGKIRTNMDTASDGVVVLKADEPKEEDEEDRSLDWPGLAIAASFALLIVSLSLLFYSFNLSSEINDKEAVISDHQATIVELQDELQQKTEMLDVLRSQNIKMIPMSGLEVNPDGYGKIWWDSEEQRALLQVSNLPTISSEKNYQLWVIQNNKPVSAGVFSIDNSSNHFYRFDPKEDIEESSISAFAVTAEPKDGAAQPTGDMYLLGDMGDKEEN